MKTSKSTDSTTQPGKGGDRISSNSRAKCDGRCKIYINEVKDNEVEKNDQKISKSKNLFKSKKTELDFFTFGARLTFTKLRQVFVKVLIIHHFDPKCYIWIETDVLGYAIGGVFS